MFSQKEMERLWLAEIDDALDTQIIKGKVISLLPMRDGLGNETFVTLIQPTESKEKEPEPYVLQTGLVSSSLCVVAELLYTSGDRGKLMRWTAEYTIDPESKKTDGGLFFLHGTALEEDVITLLRWVGNGGTVLPEKMSEAMKTKLRDYVIKTVPAMKAVSREDLRERFARNGWEIPAPGSKR